MPPLHVLVIRLTASSSLNTNFLNWFHICTTLSHACGSGSDTARLFFLPLEIAFHCAHSIYRVEPRAVDHGKQMRHDVAPLYTTDLSRLGMINSLCTQDTNWCPPPCTAADSKHFTGRPKTRLSHITAGWSARSLARCHYIL